MEPQKIVAFNIIPEKVLYGLFKEYKPLKIIRGKIEPEITEEEACETVKDATAIITFPISPYISRKILESGKKLKLVQSVGAGYDSIDIQAADELGIYVANNPGQNASTVAEHTIMLMLMTLKNILYAHNQTTSTGWEVGSRVTKLYNKTFELRDKTVGLIGLGNIGKETARRLAPFDAKVLYYKRTQLSGEEEELLGVEYRSFEDLLKESDIVSLHAPLNSDTRNMIGWGEVELMKEGSILINTSRAGLVVEEAVASALSSGKLFGAGLDLVNVKVEDGVELVDSPLLECGNVVITPHQAGPTVEARRRMQAQWSKNVIRVLRGEKPLYIVNNVR